jgi:hypothetical protein
MLRRREEAKMPTDHPVGPEAELPAALTPAAEAKRRAARRKFLMRSSAAGSGILIVTLAHQRSFAYQRKDGFQYLSSDAACTSLGKTPIQTVNVDNSLTNTGPKVAKVECG